MSKIKRLIFLVLASPFVAGIAGCPWDTPTYKATATCTTKSANSSIDFGPARIENTSIGILNTHHFVPGDVIELIPSSDPNVLGTGSRVDTLDFPDSAFVPDDAPSSTSQVVATDFTLSVDAELQAFTAQIQSELKQNTQLKLTSGSRHALAHPLDVLQSDANKNVVKRIVGHTDRQYLIVNGVVNGSELSLQYATSDSGSAGVNILKIPGTKFNVAVTYNCSNVTDLQASGQGKAGLAFFFNTVAAVNGSVDTITTADLSKYNLSNTRNTSPTVSSTKH